MKKSLPQVEIKNALEIIKEFCINRKATISVAESASSGMLQDILGSSEGASMFFEGGITTYNCEQKMEHLLIPFSECKPCGGVSEEIAKKMALGTCNLFMSNIGLSITGYASPIPEKNIYDLYAYAAIVLDHQLIYVEKINSIEDNPDDVKFDFCHQVILACAKILPKAEKKMDDNNSKFILS